MSFDFRKVAKTKRILSLNDGYYGYLTLDFAVSCICRIGERFMEYLLYCEINVMCFVMLIIMAFNVSKIDLDNSLKKTSFVSSILFCALVNVLEVLWSLCLNGIIPFSAPALHAINCAYFVALGCGCLCYYAFSKTITRKPLYKNKFLLLLYALPILAILVLSIVSYFTGWFLYFDEEGVYHRGPLFYVQHILSLGYLFLAAIDSLKMLLFKKTYTDKATYLVLLYFSIPPVVSVVLQMLFQHLPVLSTFPPISFLLIYASSLQLQVSLDPLTGIYNRRKFIMELSRKIKNLQKSKQTYLFFLDVDDFKRINDTHGHYDGDLILQTITNTLQQVSGSDGFCTRYGGDEFALVKSFDVDENVDEFCCRLEGIIDYNRKEQKLNYPITASVGYTMIDENSDVKELIVKADKEMYLAKNKKRK